MDRLRFLPENCLAKRGFWEIGRQSAADELPSAQDREDLIRSHDSDLRDALSEKFRRHPQTRPVIGREALILRCVRTAIADSVIQAIKGIQK